MKQMTQFFFLRWESDFNDFNREKSLQGKNIHEQVYTYNKIVLGHCLKSVQIRSFFWSVFTYIWTEYGDLLRKSPCSVQMQKIRSRKNSVFGHFSRSSCIQNKTFTCNCRGSPLFDELVRQVLNERNDLLKLYAGNGKLNTNYNRMISCTKSIIPW